MLTACALMLPGCATSQSATCDKPPPFFARLEAADTINPDKNGRPLPTVVQFVQVKDSAKLERASYQKLWSDPKALLGEDFLQTVEFIVPPGGEVKHWVQRDPKAQFVAAVGHFRQPLGYSWITVARLPPVSEDQCEEPPVGDRDESPKPEDTQLRFKLQGYKIDFLRPSRSTR
jgi:type VI secretion system protein VasD